MSQASLKNEISRAIGPNAGPAVGANVKIAIPSPKCEGGNMSAMVVPATTVVIANSRRDIRRAEVTYL